MTVTVDAAVMITTGARTDEFRRAEASDRA
jgi:hypothetical protein